MRRRLLVALAPMLALAAASDVQAAKSKKRDACAGASVWTSAANFLPLAIVRPGPAQASIARPRGECESDYWYPGGRFTSVDAQGRPVGVATWVETKGFDGLRRASGREGIGLYVQGESWKAPPSSTFEAERELRRTFDAFYVHLAKVHPTSVTFFHARPKSTGGPATYAVASGRAVVIGYLDPHDRWQRAYVDSWKLGAMKEPFRVRAVFDMDGDARPEVVVTFRGDLDSTYDQVLSPSRGGRRYRLVAENPDDGP